MASIVDRGPTRGLYVKFRDPAGTQHLVKVDGGAKAAETRRKEIIADLVGMGRAGEIHWRSPEDRARSTYEAEARARAESVKVSDYIERWLEDVARLKVRPRVFDGYAYALRRVWTPVLGGLELADVTRRQINDVVSQLAAAGKAASTIRNQIKPLVSLLQYALEEDRIITTNPALRIRIPSEGLARRRKVTPPTRAQVDTIVTKARGDDAREAIQVACATGLRRGELFGLRWADVDFEKRLVHVRRSNYAAELTDTKSEAGERTVPLFESTRKVLVGRKLRTRFAAPDDYVFASKVGTAYDPGNFVRREFKPALTAAKLAGVRWHDLRHYAVSALIAEGADIKLLQAVAGHASATMTLDVYGHLMTERVEAAAKLYDPLRDASTG